MRKSFFTLLASGAAAIMTTPAFAAEIIDCNAAGNTGKCSTAQDIVNLPTTNGVPQVIGTTTGGIEVSFTTNPDFDTLSSNSGAATLSAADGVLSTLFISLLGGATFTTAAFNLETLTGRQSEANSPLITFNYSDGSAAQSFALTNGQNQFGLTDGQGITGFTITSEGAPALGFANLKQLKFGGLVASPVPEPGTWAMMLVGFGGIGVAMRRRRRTSHLTQMA
jgi:hypothetical protein